MRKGCSVFSVLILLSVSLLRAQPPGYYDSAAGLSGTALQQALHDIIDDHNVATYTDLWTHFQLTDKKADGSVWDMYSDIPGGSPVYSYIFITNQCGNYDSEGDCYNREHSFPKSWFGGEILPMYTDLFHLYPTDGWVNNKRGNFPYGTTSSATWTSTNGSKLGTCSYPGYTGVVFEPVNAYKGDLARSYFYMAVRYYGEDPGWPGSDMVSGAQPKPWALKMLLEWDQSDPVSQKEKDRNESVWLIQGNRNPFIDNAAYADQIWGTPNSTEDFQENPDRVRLWPNPADDLLTISVPARFGDVYRIRIINASGKTITDLSVSGQPVTLDISELHSGYYVVIVEGASNIKASPLLISR
jgi:endonuclease I